MQRWEYTWIVIPGGLRNMRVSGRREKVPAIDVVNDMGDQGWEMVGIEQRWPGSGWSDYILFFKRPKA